MDNYYSNQISDYILNYDEAVTEITNIYNLLDSLYSSFSSASGVDIEKIRNDINIVALELDALKTKINSAMTKTKERAESCDRCLSKYMNASYPAYETSQRSYFNGANVDINGSGLITVTRYYTKKLNFLETIGSIFVSSAGEFSDQKTISKEEMFTS